MKNAELFTLPETAKALGKTTEEVRRLVQDGKLDCIQRTMTLYRLTRDPAGRYKPALPKR
jgi:hypothetical protein